MSVSGCTVVVVLAFIVVVDSDVAVSGFTLVVDFFVAFSGCTAVLGS